LRVDFRTEPPPAAVAVPAVDLLARFEAVSAAVEFVMTAAGAAAESSETEAEAGAGAAADIGLIVRETDASNAEERNGEGRPAIGTGATAAVPAVSAVVVAIGR
jgi:hypothetical protein